MRQVQLWSAQLEQALRNELLTEPVYRRIIRNPGDPTMNDAQAMANANRRQTPAERQARQRSRQLPRRLVAKARCRGEMAEDFISSGAEHATASSADEADEGSSGKVDVQSPQRPRRLRSRHASCCWLRPLRSRPQPARCSDRCRLPDLRYSCPAAAQKFTCRTQRRCKPCKRSRPSSPSFRH